MLLSLECINKGFSIYFENKLYSDASPAENLVPTINKLAPLKDITELAISIGPASFTGVRIPIAFAEGLKLANPNLQVFGVNSFQALASKACIDYSKNNIAINAMRSQAFLKDSNGNMSLVYLEDLPKENLHHNIEELNIGSYIESPTAEDVHNFYINNKSECETNIAPLYIRPPDAKKQS